MHPLLRFYSTLRVLRFPIYAICLYIIAMCVSVGLCLGIIAIGIGSVASYGIAQWWFGWFDPTETRNLPYLSTYAIFWLKFTVGLVIFQILCTARTFEAMRKEYIQKNGDI